MNVFNLLSGDTGSSTGSTWVPGSWRNWRNLRKREETENQEDAVRKIEDELVNEIKRLLHEQR